MTLRASSDVISDLQAEVARVTQALATASSQEALAAIIERPYWQKRAEAAEQQLTQLQQEIKERK